MRFEFAFPEEAKRAKEEYWPLCIPIGTIEYHGPHCSFGCDTLIVQGLLEEIEKKRDIVIYPPVWYGAASYAVAGPEKDTVHVDADVIEKYVYEILRNLIYGGWRNIYLVIHHQYEEENLLPMTLACMKAAKTITFRYLEEQRGNGWWGDNNNKGFYDQLEAAENPWNWITVLPAMSARAQSLTGYDHAGKFECSILQKFYPEAVKLDRLSQSDEWFIQSAKGANDELGDQMVRESLEDANKRIK